MPTSEFILTLRSPDRPGILAEVSSFLLAQDADIRDAAQYGDPETSEFFIRIHLISPKADLAMLNAAFAETATRRGFTWQFFDCAERLKLLIAVSKHGHCLVDLLHRWKTGALPVDIVGVVSNHQTMKSLTQWYEVPFHYLPITPEGKAEQEAQFAAVIKSSGVELVALARYMQVLSNEFSARLAGSCINIHHSFLPSFKGAKPYHQAYLRGVKLIGATAHYVTADLDEGPIIEQDVRRVSHAPTADDMVALGREVEASVLARAIKWHAERRIFVSGHRTIILG